MHGRAVFTYISGASQMRTSSALRARCGDVKTKSILEYLLDSWDCFICCFTTSEHN